MKKSTLLIIAALLTAAFFYLWRRGFFDTQKVSSGPIYGGGPKWPTG
jgi:hypothetical protein